MSPDEREEAREIVEGHFTALYSKETTGTTALRLLLIRVEQELITDVALALAKLRSPPVVTPEMMERGGAALITLLLDCDGIQRRTIAEAVLRAALGAPKEKP